MKDFKAVPLHTAILYFDPKTREIGQEGSDIKLTPDEARQMWLKGQVLNCNLAFMRLVNFDFDVKKTIESYDD